MRTPIVCVALQLLTTLSHAQISEHFDALPPPWKGIDTAWQLNNGKLQSNCLQTNSFFGLYAPAGIKLSATWEWWMQLDFNTSANNYVDIYLMADNSNLLSADLSGYFVRVGGTADEIALYKRAGNAAIKLIDGRDDLTNKSSSRLKLKVTCDSAFQWQLWVDTSATGSHYAPAGTATDSTAAAALCFGLLIRQSTASFFQQHFFDDVRVGPPRADTPVLPAPDSTRLLLSELLFDPAPMAPEFIEIYNPGPAAADLQHFYVSMQDGEGLPRNKVPLSREQRLLSPGAYMALTRDPAALCRYYTCKAPENVLQVGSLPALPNEGGRLGLYNAEEQLLDWLQYSPDMQSPLAGNTKGVSLERLSFQQPAGDPGNWRPAAQPAGYATPGSANSQGLNLQELVGELTVQPPVFSPDNDGVDDVAVIACRLPQAGCIANILVFDAQGRPVRRLLQNGLLGTGDNIIWDGLGENKQALPVGIYIIFTEIFDLQGRIKRWKLPVVMARNLNLN